MTPSRAYFDACCFVELAKGKFGKALTRDGAFLWHLETLLRASRLGKVEVCTSILSVAECTSAEGDIDAKVQELFVGLLTSGKGGVTLLQTDIWTVERARDLRWKHGLNFRSADAIHVASALEAKCDELITMDGLSASKKSMLKSSAQLSAIGIRAIEPDKTALIPPEFMQQTMKYKTHDSNQPRPA